MPPPTLKEAIVIPKKVKIASPVNRAANRIALVETPARKAVFFFSFSRWSAVRLIKIGTAPMGLTIAIRAAKKLKYSGQLPISINNIPIGEKRLLTGFPKKQAGP